MTRKEASGRIPGYPDFRDYTEEKGKVGSGIEPTDPALRLWEKRASMVIPPPAAVDLRESRLAIEDQGRLGSGTARAVVGIIECYEGKSFGRKTDASRLSSAKSLET